MITLLHTFNPQPILFEFGWLSIRWYGFLMMLGVVAGFIVVKELSRGLGASKDSVYDLAFYLIIFSLFGARVYAVLLELPYYLQNPTEIIAVWHGGLAIHGAIIGGALTLFIYARRKRQSFWQWADLLCVALPIGQAIGRWGNYFNQELFGRPTDLSWGIPIAVGNRPTGYTTADYFHPTFFYESLLNLLNFIVLLVLFNKLKKKPGTLALVYVINYSIIRIVMELFRIDHTPAPLGIRLPIIVSGALIVVSIGVLVRMMQRPTSFDTH